MSPLLLCVDCHTSCLRFRSSLVGHAVSLLDQSLFWFFGKFLFLSNLAVANKFYSSNSTFILLNLWSLWQTKKFYLRNFKNYVWKFPATLVKKHLKKIIGPATASVSVPSLQCRQTIYKGLCLLSWKVWVYIFYHLLVVQWLVHRICVRVSSVRNRREPVFKRFIQGQKRTKGFPFKLFHTFILFHFFFWSLRIF